MTTISSWNHDKQIGSPKPTNNPISDIMTALLPQNVNRVFADSLSIESVDVLESKGMICESAGGDAWHVTLNAKKLPSRNVR